jgi:chemotaxis signal transduction protein
VELRHARIVDDEKRHRPIGVVPGVRVSPIMRIMYQSTRYMIDELAVTSGADGAAGVAREGRGRPVDGADDTRLLVIGRIGDHRFALPAAAIGSCLRMAAVTPLPDVPGGVVGVLNLNGVILPVVDPRPRFGLPTPPYHPEQYLVLVRARRDYLLWVDRLEQTFAARRGDFAPTGLDGEATGVAGATGAPEVTSSGAGAGVTGRPAFVHSLVRIAGEVVPVLSLEALAPGQPPSSPDPAPTPRQDAGSEAGAVAGAVAGAPISSAPARTSSIVGLS